LTIENDSLRDTLESAFDAAEAPDTPAIDTGTAAPAATATDTATTEAGRARDEAGRFAARQAAAAEPAAAAQPAAAPAAANAALDAAAQAAGAAGQSTAKAPSSWKPEAAAVWAKIDAGQPVTPAELKTFRDEAARREGDYHKGVQGWKQHATAGQAYEAAVAPYQETLQKLGVDGITAVSELLKADHTLRYAPDSVKVQKLLELAHVYNIDLSKQFTPEIAKYERELFDMKEKLAQNESAQQQNARESLDSELTRFAAAPGHEHFEAVRAHMGSLLSGGVAKDLEEAYQQAVYANPQTRAALLDQQRRASDETARLQRARAASGSVRGSSPAAGTPSAGGNSVRDAITAAFDAQS
jgi:transcriptional regulator with XRE-family HTH domain